MSTRQRQVVPGAHATRLERVVRGSAEGFWECTLATGAVWLSARARALLGPGLPSGPVPLRQLLRLLDVGARATLARAWRAHRDRAQAFEALLQVQVAGRRRRWFRLRGEVAADVDGNTCYLSGSCSNVDAWQRARGRLEWQVDHDPLTALSNRRHFLDRVATVLRAQRDERDVRAVVLAMDFDRFKHVNDVHGHAVGDQLLQRIADRLRGEMEPDGLACRFGGDEFAVLLADVKGVQDAAHRAERLHARLAAPYRLSGGQVIACSASIGVLYLAAADYRDPADVLRDADAAMYQAKAAGGRVQFFDAQVRERIARVAKLEQSLRRALELDELTLHYQPVVCLDTGRVRAVEALVRWHRGGEVRPVPADEFIPLAEDTGLIVDIGRWIADRALADLVRLRASAAPAVAGDMRLALNVSRRELMERDYSGWLLANVTRHGLRPTDVILEITETAFVDDGFEIAATAAALADAGFALALDDFGTGQSSLNSLQELPIAIVKIDKKFIRALTRRSEFMAVVHAIVQLGHCLSLEIVAEGVESAAEVGALQAMECTMGQGYHFSRPLPVSRMQELLRASGSDCRLTGLSAPTEDRIRRADTGS